MRAQGNKRILLGLVIVGLISILIVVLSAYSAELKVENNKLASANEALQSEIDTLSVKIKSAKRIITNTTTGISKVENLEVAKDGKSFNLAGQQVGKNYKGVVIKNGKKMVIK